MAFNTDSVSISAFQEEVFTFYHEHGRHELSFRQTQDPYHIHLSEIMLSQTQVSRVETYFCDWLEVFPSLADIAHASTTELLTHWQGLGYNSRVLHFQHACQIILTKHRGIYPKNEAQLLALKGVGPYVASAILAFAFNINVGVVDTNIRRILLYYGFIDEHTPTKKIQQIAQSLTPLGRAREWNNALMDFGALKLTAKSTGIASLSKQGKFAGSTREVRSFIVKSCVSQGYCTVAQVEQFCQINAHNSEAIIQKLIGENIIVRTDNTLTIRT